MAIGILTGGEVPERLNGPVLKTGGRKSRGFESHPLRHALAALATIGIVAGCAGTVTSFLLSFPAQGALKELPGVLNDQTGLVVSVDEVPPVEAPVVDDFMRHDPAMPNAVMIQWLGGACDARVEITVSGSPYQTILVEPKRQAGICDAGGISRAILITFSRPIDQQQATFDIQRG